MYAIYADNELLYAPDMANLGYIVTDAQLTTEINKAGSLEFTIPVTNPNYNAYSKLKSIIRLEQDGTEIWRGRVLDDTKDTDLNKDVMCEGELAFLNDMNVRKYDYSSGISVVDYFNRVMNYYGGASSYRSIKAGNVTVPNTTLEIKMDEATNTCLNELSSNLVGAIGGYLRLRRSNDQSYLDYIDAYSQTSNQVIEFGSNILSIEEYIDASDVYTVIIPFGKQDDNGNRVNITSVNNGSDFIESSQGASLFGRIDRSVVWDDVTDPNVLKQQAQSVLNSAIEMATTITISAVDLHLIDVNTDAIQLGDWVRVISPPHGIDSDFLCSKVVINLQNPDQSQYTFGLAFDALTDKQVATNKQTRKSYDLAVSTADNYNTLKNETYQNYVSKAEFNSQIGQLQDKIDDIVAPDLSGYLKKDTADSLYAAKTDLDVINDKLDDLTKRVEALENK
jgi:hypothetical protein